MNLRLEKPSFYILKVMRLKILRRLYSTRDAGQNAIRQLANILFWFLEVDCFWKGSVLVSTGTREDVVASRGWWLAS